MPSSILRVTSLDHDRIRRLARRACTPGPSQARWRDELVQLVRAHRVAEDETLTPDVVAQSGISPADLDSYRGTDQALDDAAATLAAADVGSPGFLDTGQVLLDALAAHVDSLEAILQPLEKAVPRKEVRRLGGAYTDRRDDVLRDQGAAEPPRRLDLSRAELYELAKRAGIDGRSAMSRRDLISALERLQQTR